MTEDGPREFAEFADRLHRIRQRAGSPSLSQLVALTTGLPRPLARSTISDKLTAKSLPDWDFVASYLAACAAYAEQCGSPLPAASIDVAEWDAAHLRMLRAVDRTRGVDRLAAAARAQLSHRGAALSAEDQADEIESSVVPRHPPAALRRFTAEVPAQLPADVPFFTGRQAHLDRLDRLLPAGTASAVVIATIAGTAGVGKPNPGF